MGFNSTFEYKLIYVFRINNDDHKGILKIGDATIHTDKNWRDLQPNCRELNQAAKARIKQYTSTAGVEIELLHTEIAVHEINKNGIRQVKAFRDHQVHRVLERSGIERKEFREGIDGKEWYYTDLETAKKAISAVKNNQSSLNPNDISTDRNPIIFRPEQEEAIQKTLKVFKKNDKMLWNAKMRFGKTLTALEVAKRAGYKKVLICTHRPVVEAGWFDDFHKIFYDTGYHFGSKNIGDKIEDLAEDEQTPFVYFASMQDLRGSQAVGGKYDKNDYIFLVDWDYIVVDEAHEGTQTELGANVLENIKSTYKNSHTKVLELSGTPFNLLDQYNESEIFTWDYIKEQQAKNTWSREHFGDSNPYEELPKLEIYTYDLGKLIGGYEAIEDKAFNFREFFRTWTGDVERDYKAMPEGKKVGDFVHEADVNHFLDLLCKKDDDSNYPYATDEYRSYFRHTLWMLPGVKEAKAMSELLKAHPVFGSGSFNIANVAGDGDDDEQSYKNSLEKVRKAITNDPDEAYSITLSCGRLTTGVTVPEWTAVFMLSGSFNTSAASYMQTIFRVQSPANINGRIKERCCVFDFAPDRTLNMVAEAGKLSTKAGEIDSDRKLFGDFLNFCPIISIDGSSMVEYNVDNMLQQLKKAYVERVVSSGFEDNHIYNDNMLKLNDIDIKQFETLKGIIGTTKQTKKTEEIPINEQGLTEGEYEEIKKVLDKPKKERTAEDLEKLAEYKKKNDLANKAKSILRGVSIRIPLLIYGADIPIEQEVTPENFTELIDDKSWEEFMPNGVTKEVYMQFAKYYEQDIFVAAGKKIRMQALGADDLNSTERVMRIADIFSTFKNPDKETVLTPWRVVNMHMSDTLGGYDFYDELHEHTLDMPRFVDNGQVTKDTLQNNAANILEINSKTGLYPLYVVYSIYRNKLDQIDKEKRTKEVQDKLWLDTVANNIYVICKTEMARTITKRTLLGYKKGKINAHAFDDLIMQIKDKQEQLVERIKRKNFWNKEAGEMKFDAVVGNPPYQENISNDDKNSSLGKQLFPGFIICTTNITSKYVSLITPSRWFAGDAQDKSFLKLRDYIRDKKGFMKLVNFSDASEVFNSVEIKGGVNYFLYKSGYNDKVTFINRNNGHDKTSIRDLFVSGLDVILTETKYYDILEKVKKCCEISLTTITKGRNAFGIVGREDKVEKVSDANYKDGYAKLRCKNNEIRYIDPSKITKNVDVFNAYKVLISKSAGSPGKDKKVIGLPYLGEPQVACTDSLIPIGCFDNKQEAENLQKYMYSKFLRFLVSLLKVSQNVSQNVYEFVPIQDFTEKSDIDWSKSIAEIDAQLYAKYKLTEDEIEYIEQNIKPMA